jgi:tetratricopeptide (TPR) repeat protein
MKISIVLLAGFFLLCCRSARATPCADKTYAGEELSRGGDYSKATPILEDAVRLCSASSQEKSARPYIALGVAYKNMRRYPEAIKQFETALAKQPGLPLAYMDMGAVYQEMHQYQKSIDVTKKALGSGDPRYEMEADYNIGLSYFKIAAESNATSDKRSEPYFKKSAELDPTFGGSFYYLGVIKEAMNGD